MSADSERRIVLLQFHAASVLLREGWSIMAFGLTVPAIAGSLGLLLFQYGSSLRSLAQLFIFLGLIPPFSVLSRVRSWLKDWATWSKHTVKYIELTSAQSGLPSQTSAPERN